MVLIGVDIGFFVLLPLCELVSYLIPKTALLVYW
jgi:hypothetical protein